MNRKHKKFTESLLKWFDLTGRKDLPWQQPRSAYRVWLSEMMLQQTQVKTVIPYFLRFIARFPDIQTLASATEDEILALWAGLGYYSRARFIHQTAQIIVQQYQGQFPIEITLLRALPGIGPSTAAAIASLAFNQPTAILDGNVKRILSRYFKIAGVLTQQKTLTELWQLAKECMPISRCADYTQAIMDLGALCCTPKRPHCIACPIQDGCQAFATGQVALYPTKTVKTPLPYKEQQFLLLHHQDQIYLEKRPARGIWGGLWCLPMHDTTDDALTRFQVDALQAYEFMTLKHTFTHFHLQIKVIAIPCMMPLAKPQGWFTAAGVNTLGLPKPIKTIVESYFEQRLSKQLTTNIII